MIHSLRNHIRRASIGLAFICAVSSQSFASDTAKDTVLSASASLLFPGETRLANIRQLTFGGENAEAYFTPDGRGLTFQSSRDGRGCDAIYYLDIETGAVRAVSSGKGATTCSFMAPDGKTIIYASTHLGGDSCPTKPDMSRGYVWAVYNSYDIFACDPNGANLRRLTTSDKYDAECVFSMQGDKILFTSARDGDLEVYTMNPDGTNQTRITNAPGYDGGAWFSFDGKKICWRASRPTDSALTEYQSLLAEGLVRPSKMELFVANADGSNPEQLTTNGRANFCPFFHPTGKYLVFASNMNDPKGRNFDLFTIDLTTKKIDQITFGDSFDGFPMFSYDGKKLVFASNRFGKERGETNLFIADWRE